MRRALVPLLALGAAFALPACGAAAGEEAGGRPVLTISAASSLKSAFEDYARSRQGPSPRFSFAGSNQLAAQIRRGARPDVYAAASTMLPRALFEEGLVGRPLVFASNELVIAVPAGAGGIDSMRDLARPGVEIAAGALRVPVGAYTRELLSRLRADERHAILANVRSNEPDVASIVGKLVKGSADAGFVYRTDVRAAGGALRAIALPDELRPRVAYAAAVVEGARAPAAARAFVRGLRDGRGAEALRSAGFEPAPR